MGVAFDWGWRRRSSGRWSPSSPASPAIGELFGLSRSLTLPLAAAALLVIVASGSYQRVERAALIIGLFELAFFVVAWDAHPGLAALARDAVDLPLGNRDFLFWSRRSSARPSTRG